MSGPRRGRPRPRARGRTPRRRRGPRERRRPAPGACRATARPGPGKGTPPAAGPGRLGREDDAAGIVKARLALGDRRPGQPQLFAQVSCEAATIARVAQSASRAGPRRAIRSAWISVCDRSQRGRPRRHRAQRPGGRVASTSWPGSSACQTSNSAGQSRHRRLGLVDQCCGRTPRGRRGSWCRRNRRR